MKNRIKLLFLTILFISLFGCKENKAIDDKLEIGAIVPITGPASYIGESIYNGIRLSELSNQDVLKINYEDSQALPKNGVSSYQKLKNEGIKIFIPSFTSVTNAIIPLVKDNDLLFATSVSSSGITQKSENLFRLFVHADGDADKMASFASDSLKINKIGVIYINDDFGLDYLKTFQEETINKGGEILIKIPFDKTNNDFKNVALKAKASKVQAFYVIGYDKNLIQLLKEYAIQKIDKPIFSIATIGQDNVYTEIKPILNQLPSIYYTNTEFTSKEFTNDIKKRFITSYEKMFNKAPDYFAAFSYDLVEIIGKAQKENPENIKEYILNNTFNGVMGSIDFDSSGDANIKMIIEKLN